MKIFIPIKEESQRVPRKNFRSFRGLPLYQYFIFKFLRNTGYEIFVDTDSKKVLDWASDKEQVTTYNRKENLVGHKVSVNSLIKNFIEEFEVEEPVAQLHVTSPLLKVKTLKEASNYLEDENYDSVVSCDIFYERFWRKYWTSNGDEMKAINHKPDDLVQTQDLNPLYVENSAFYIFEPSVFLENTNRIGNNPYFFEVEYPENIDIDTEEDWKLVKNI